MQPPEGAGAPEVVVYGTLWCGHCVRLRRFLDEHGIPYREVDVDADEAAARRVVAANGGNRTVPTVELPDGRLVTNPTPPELLALLRHDVAG